MRLYTWCFRSWHYKNKIDFLFNLVNLVNCFANVLHNLPEEWWRLHKAVGLPSRHHQWGPRLDRLAGFHCPSLEQDSNALMQELGTGNRQPFHLILTIYPEPSMRLYLPDGENRQISSKNSVVAESVFLSRTEDAEIVRTDACLWRNHWDTSIGAFRSRGKYWHKCLCK